MIMKLQTVTYETSELAKGAGFDWKTLYYYVVIKSPTNFRKNGEVVETVKKRWSLQNNEGDVFINHNSKKYNRFAAPEQELLRQWLREVHSVEISIVPMKSSRKTKRLYEGHIFLYDQKGVIVAGGETLPHLLLFSNYEDCLEATLQESFNWI